MWIMIIAYNLYLVVVKNHINISLHEKLYSAIVWVPAFFAALLPVFMENGGYGLAGIWCWIIRDLIFARFVLFYIPLYVIIITVIALYVVIIINILRKFKEVTEEDDPDKVRANEFTKRIIAYPIIFVIIYFFPTVNRIYDWLHEDDSFALYVLHGMTSPLLGFVSALYYGFDKEMRRSWKDWLVLRGVGVTYFKEDKKENVNATEDSTSMVNLSFEDE